LSTQKKSVRYLTECGVIAALYAATVQALGFMGYGVLQFRVAEALTLLPIFTPAAIPGVTIGCAIANILGMSENPAGAWDILLGPAATLCAAILTRQLRNLRWLKLPVLASLPPVILNAVVVGSELYWAFIHSEKIIASAWIGSMLSIGLGQVAACCVLGLALVFALEKSKAAKYIFSPKT